MNMINIYLHIYIDMYNCIFSPLFHILKDINYEFSFHYENHLGVFLRLTFCWTSVLQMSIEVMNSPCTKLIFSTCLSGFEHHAVVGKRPVIYGILLIIFSKWQQLWCIKYLLIAVTQRLKKKNEYSSLLFVCRQVL